MNLYNLIYMLEGESTLCEYTEVGDIMYLIGIVLLAIKIVVPIILIVVGMIDLVSAISQQNEDALKKATSKLAKKAVAAIAVFLVATIVGLLMGLIGGKQYEACMDCINAPFSENCNSTLKNNRAQ